jgi:hypothetical protein
VVHHTFTVNILVVWPTTHDSMSTGCIPWMSKHPRYVHMLEAWVGGAFLKA